MSAIYISDNMSINYGQTRLNLILPRDSTVARHLDIYNIGFGN